MSLFPGEPSGPPPSKINGGLKSGRSVSSYPDNSMSAKAKSARNNTTMADIDKLLEEDAVVLMNMKRDLEKAQQNEIRKSFIHLQEIQKQHDTIHRENNLREKQLLNATNVLNGLKTFIDGGKKVTEEDERFNRSDSFANLVLLPHEHEKRMEKRLRKSIGNDEELEERHRFTILDAATSSEKGLNGVVKSHHGTSH